MAQGTRTAMLGWTELLDEQIAAPARERLLRGEVERFPDEVRVAFTTMIRLAQRCSRGSAPGTSSTAA